MSIIEDLKRFDAMHDRLQVVREKLDARKKALKAQLNKLHNAALQELHEGNEMGFKKYAEEFLKIDDDHNAITILKERIDKLHKHFHGLEKNVGKFLDHGKVNKDTIHPVRQRHLSKLIKMKLAHPDVALIQKLEKTVSEKIDLPQVRVAVLREELRGFVHKAKDLRDELMAEIKKEMRGKKKAPAKAKPKPPKGKGMKKR